MFNNIFFIILIILLIFIVICLYIKSRKLIHGSVKSVKDSKKFNNATKSNSIHSKKPLIKSHENIKKEKKNPKIKYNYLYKSLYGGQDIGFVTRDNKYFHIYSTDFFNDKIIEHDLFKNSSSSKDIFVNFKDENNIHKIIINKPTSIRTCLQNNINYVTSFSDKKVYLIDISSNKMKIKDKINIGKKKGATYIDLYRNLKKNINYGYTSNFNNHSVSILDLNKKIKIKDIKVGKNPIFVCVSEKNKLLFVANFSDNNICCFDLSDPENPTKINNFNTGVNPTCIQTDDEKIYVTNYNSSTISVFNINNNEISKDEDILIPNNEKIYSMDLNSNANSGCILTCKNIYTLDKDINKLIKVEFTEEENKNIGTCKSVRYKYYKPDNIHLLYILNINGKLSRKIIEVNKKVYKIKNNDQSFSKFHSRADQLPGSNEYPHYYINNNINNNINNKNDDLNYNFHSI
jgi:DNA-binding beta-propeller fold protein YncE